MCSVWNLRFTSSSEVYLFLWGLPLSLRFTSSSEVYLFLSGFPLPLRFTSFSEVYLFLWGLPLFLRFHLFLWGLPLSLRFTSFSEVYLFLWGYHFLCGSPLPLRFTSFSEVCSIIQFLDYSITQLRYYSITHHNLDNLNCSLVWCSVWFWISCSTIALEMWSSLPLWWSFSYKWV